MEGAHGFGFKLLRGRKVDQGHHCDPCEGRFVDEFVGDGVLTTDSILSWEVRGVGGKSKLGKGMLFNNTSL